MEKIFLGKSALKVSKVGLGAINYGSKTTDEDAFSLLDTFTEYGGNFIDTANNYAVWNGGDGGESERTIGKWMQLRNNRKDMIVATKLGALPKDINKSDFNDMQGLSKESIFSSVKQSLINLQTDYIDLLYLHVDDFNTSQIETMSALNELVEKGIVKEIGCSNFRTWRIEKARNICKQNGFRFFCVIQQRHSYLTPVDVDLHPQVAMNLELNSYLDYYKDLTLVAYSVLLKGQYNKKDIEKDEYKTYFNQIKLNKLLEEEKDPNIWVLNYITGQNHGSIALVTTSSKEHLINIMTSIK